MSQAADDQLGSDPRATLLKHFRLARKLGVAVDLRRQDLQPDQSRAVVEPVPVADHVSVDTVAAVADSRSLAARALASSNTRRRILLWYTSEACHHLRFGQSGRIRKSSLSAIWRWTLARVPTFAASTMALWKSQRVGLDLVPLQRGDDMPSLADKVDLTL